MPTTFEEWCSAALSASAGGKPLTVVDFGAQGDERTDDTAAIQLAIDVAIATTGAVFLALPAGKYKVGKR